ncbi:MAG TPA: molecular chaperone DnaJ [Candidatus Nanoarchaeia archaeon]|nr:molecular chaperone DnaJ [Candidatus Nanoarchaeia archaeon]
MANKDYYQLLGVEKGSTKEEIKKAYKKLALKYHPDRAPEDKKKEYEEKFKEINEAASILSDDKKRQQYDQYGSSSFQGGQGGQGGFEGFDFSDLFRSQGNFDDVFDQLFGGDSGRRGSRARRGSDLAYEIEITLEEAFKGLEKEIPLNKLEECSSCHGKGAHSFESCHHCQGSGYMKRVQRTAFGMFQQSGPCPYCKGRGELPQDSCSECGGEGVVRRRKKIEVTIPPGVEEGMRLRVPGEGEIGTSSGLNGDLYLIIHIKKHDYFVRQGDDLHLTVPISFTQAALGDDLEVPTIDGKAKLKIPAGTQSETILRMKDKGMPNVRGHYSGDQMVKVHVEIPKSLTKKQIDLIKQLKEEKPSKGFLEKIFG